MSVTAKEIARQLGVSEATVSFALRGKSGVSTQTTHRVLEAALPPNREKNVRVHEHKEEEPQDHERKHKDDLSPLGGIKWACGP